MSCLFISSLARLAFRGICAPYKRKTLYAHKLSNTTETGNSKSNLALRNWHCQTMPYLFLSLFIPYYSVSPSPFFFPLLSLSHMCSSSSSFTWEEEWSVRGGPWEVRGGGAWTIRAKSLQIRVSGWLMKDSDAGGG